MNEIRRLPLSLKRNGISYTMVSRTENAILWKLSIRGSVVGYEVSQIRILFEKLLFGKNFPTREVLPPDSRFGRFDKSKCFFSNEYDRAIEYLRIFDNFLMKNDLYALHEVA